MRASSNPQRSFEEVDLPFDVISTDHISGSRLYGVLNQVIEDDLDDYTVESHIGDYDCHDPRGHLSGGFGYEVRAVKENFDTEDSSEEAVYISFEGVSSGTYSHLTAELVAPTVEQEQVLKEELEDIERGIGRYFRRRRFLTAPAQRTTYTAD